MKRTITLCLLIACGAFSLFSAGIDELTYNNLIAGITRTGEPVVSGKYIIFTANGSARHTGIAFEHEDYKAVHELKRLVRKDPDGKETGNLLFHIAEVPPGLRAIRYRMVINGLWTTDPLNPSSEYDYNHGMTVSRVPVEYYEVFQTSNVSRGLVRFTWEGETGKTIRLAGTFNAWDPFMYELVELSPGKYELSLPLPKGTWHYAFFDGTRQVPDTINRDRVYTKDGRVASVIVID